SIMRFHRARGPRHLRVPLQPVSNLCVKASWKSGKTLLSSPSISGRQEISANWMRTRMSEAERRNLAEIDSDDDQIETEVSVSTQGLADLARIVEAIVFASSEPV